MATPSPEDRKKVKIVVDQPREMTEIEVKSNNPKPKKEKKKGQEKTPPQIDGMKIIKP